MKSTQTMDTENLNLKQCFDEAKQELDSALSEINCAYELLEKAKNNEKDGCYTNAVLQANVNKEQECKELLSRLVKAKEEVNDKLKKNMDTFNKKRMELIAALAEISEDTHKLMKNLEKWRIKAERIRYDFAQAEEEFKSIQEKIENSKRSWLGFKTVNKETEYAEFLKKFQHVAKLAGRDNNGCFAQCENIEPLPDLMPICIIDPSRKTPLELKVLADLTKDASLIEEAKQLSKKTDEYNKKSIISKKDISFAQLDKDEHKKLISSASNITEEYAAKSKELLQESGSLMDQIDLDQKLLLSEVTAAGDPKESFLHRDRRAFDAVRIEMKKAYNEWIDKQKKALKQREVSYGKDGDVLDPGVNKAREVFEEKLRSVLKKYKQLVASCESANESYENAHKRKWEIAEKYEQAGKKFGTSRAEEGYHFIFVRSKKPIDDLSEAIEIAENTINRNKKMISVQTSLMLQVELVNVIKNIVEKNLVFWNRQVSCFGSRYMVGGVKVPCGIAQLYRDLQLIELYSSGNMLKILQQSIKARKIAGPGFFARRVKTTTDKFYDLLLNLNFDKVTEDTLKKLREDLALIRDDKGGLLFPGQVEVPLLAEYRRIK